MSNLVRQMVHWVTYEPTISTSAYADGDQLGTAQKFQLPACNNEPVRLLDIIVTDKAKQDAKIDFYFFGADPSETSADNDPIAVPTSSIPSFYGITQILACDYFDLGGYSGASLGSILRGIIPDSSGCVWVLPKIREAKTYTATDDLSFKFNFALDYS